MKPLQVYVDEAELARLEAWSRARGWTKAQAVRAALRALTAAEHEDPLLASSGMIDGLPPDLGRRFDAYLQETFVAKKAATAARPRRGARQRLRR